MSAKSAQGRGKGRPRRTRAVEGDAYLLALCAHRGTVVHHTQRADNVEDEAGARQQVGGHPQGHQAHNPVPEGLWGEWGEKGG